MDAATIRIRISEAEQALHQLQMGKAMVRITDQNGETVEFNRMSASGLQAYIDRLYLMLSNVGAGRGPLRVFF